MLSTGTKLQHAIKSSASEAKPMENYNKKSNYQRSNNMVLFSVIDKLGLLKQVFENKSEIVLADYGCSHGYNSILFLKEVFSKVNLKKKAICSVYLNDLPSNDFNQIFKCLQDPQISYNYLSKFATNSEASVNTYCNGNSFYNRVMSNKTVDMAISLFTLHWLPRSIPLKSAFTPQNCNVTENEKIEITAIAKETFDLFLDARSKELKSGGILIFNLLNVVDENKYIDAKWQQFLELKELGHESFVVSSLPIYWRSEDEFNQSLDAVSDKFNVLCKELLDQPETKLSPESFRSIYYNSISGQVKKSTLFNDEKEAEVFVDEFMNMLCKEYNDFERKNYLIVLERK